MLHSAPRDRATRFAASSRSGAAQVVAIVLAPQYSPLILTGYERALDAAVAETAPSLPVRLRRRVAHHRVVGGLAVRPASTEALDGFDAADRDRVAVVFTAHSLPRAVVERDPGYMVQVRGDHRRRRGAGRPRPTIAGSSRSRAPATRPRSG